MDGGDDSPALALHSPTRQSGFSLARPLLKRGTVLLRNPEDDSPTANVVFERRDHAKRISAKFHYKATPGPVKPTKNFKIFPQAMEHDLKALEQPQQGEIFRHRQSHQGNSGSNKSQRSPSEGETTSISRLNFTSKLNRLLLNSRVNVAREHERDRTEKQIAVEAILSDGALTPTMQRRKIAVVEQLYLDKESEKRKEKEATSMKELDDALKGKR